MHHLWLAVTLAVTAVSAPSAVADADARAAGVKAELYSVTWQIRPGVIAIAVACDAVANAGAVATSVDCTISTGGVSETSAMGLPGGAAAATVLTVVSTRPVVACAVGRALFIDGAFVTSESYCRDIVPA